MIRQHQPANGIVTLMRRALLACAVLASMSLTPELALAQEAGPIANAGPDRTIADTDGLPGETVTLDGTASLPSVPGQTEITSYVWTNAQGVRIGVGPTPTVRLPDGVNQIRLVVSEIYDYGEGAETYTSSDTVTITVLPTSAPTANAGPDRAVPDTDNEPGELVTLTVPCRRIPTARSCSTSGSATAIRRSVRASRPCLACGFPMDRIRSRSSCTTTSAIPRAIRSW